MSQMLKATNTSMNPAAAAAATVHAIPLQQTGPAPKGPYIQQRRPEMTPHGGPTTSFASNQTLMSGYSQQQMASPPIPPNPLANVPLSNQNGTLRVGQSGVGGGVTLVDPQSGPAPQMEPLTLEEPQSLAPSQQQEGQSALANTKEKTPMCLINELARYNKILHQYTLVDEQGPAHKKTFFVKLKLGEEEYSASGPSIKKAQHSAAAIALEKTSFTHPPPKPNRTPNMGSMTEIDSRLPQDFQYESNNITPTVELNALAMKRGEPAVYKPIEPRHPQFYSPPNFDYRGMYNQRYHCGRMPRTFYVSLKVGQKEFIGDGPTRQAARHNAATKALRILRNMSMPADNKGDNKEEIEEDDQDQLKSEISLVHEIALKRNLPVDFEVIRESGPPHMKTFVTKCTVGEFLTEAEGNSKKLSKKRAAELMLEELKKLPALPATTMRPKVKNAVNKKKNRNLIKLSDSLVPSGGSAYGAAVERTDGLHAGQVQKADPSYGSGINPISRLIQIMQAQKKKEPVYSLVAERGLPRRREFVMQVQVEDHTCTGVGPNKKLAKRNAAEAMLQLLGYSRPSPQPAKSSIKTSTGPDVGTGDKKVTFSDNSPDNGASLGGITKTGRQLVPGLLLIPQAGMGQGMGSPLGPIRPEQQLRELAARNNFQVQFDDFSGQNNSKEHLSRLSLSTTPPQVHHGSGPTPESSRDKASMDALKVLSDMGYYIEDKTHIGDGLQIKSEINTSIPPPTLGGATSQLMKE
ncbi:double-stranded RNA-binding protein Staufen homolog isoform X2 [Haliotis rufescens]|uniref:double-stranded RNA-binding protein Staufen homolog isoform X2 n=1 Tax=Haliotis rufescens TaxID=6454 RepID=UPI001EB07FBE|nr:double-stranded RNA-binding protein Staufen homolog isoform X2 [Haliotis rufescens]